MTADATYQRSKASKARRDTEYQRKRAERLERECRELREQMERLVTLLRIDCDVEASWDGLRKFWSISLTEDGCLMRDRACKAEAENEKLRELSKWAILCSEGDVRCAACPYHDKAAEPHIICTMRKAAIELGIECK